MALTAANIVLLITISLITHSSSVSPRSTITENHCLKLNVQSGLHDDWAGKTAVWYGMKCIISSRHAALWDKAKASCNNYAQGQLMGIYTAEQKEVLREILVNEWSALPYWTFYILESYDKPGQQNLAFNVTSGVVQEKKGIKRAFICEYVLGELTYYVPRSECLRLDEGMKGKIQRNAVIGWYCYRTSRLELKWNESRYSCDEYAHGHLAIVNTRAKKDELNVQMKKWGATNADKWAYWVLQSTSSLNHPAYRYNTGFFDGKDAKMNFVCQYPIREYVCRKYGPCQVLWETGIPEVECNCPPKQRCTQLVPFRYNMKKDYSRGFSKILAATDFYMAYKTRADQSILMVTGTCTDIIL